MFRHIRPAPTPELSSGQNPAHLSSSNEKWLGLLGFAYVFLFCCLNCFYSPMQWVLATPAPWLGVSLFDAALLTAVNIRIFCAINQPSHAAALGSLSRYSLLRLWSCILPRTPGEAKGRLVTESLDLRSQTLKPPRGAGKLLAVTT